MGWSMLLHAGSAFEPLADVLFPPLCYACGALLPHGSRVACPPCVATIQKVDFTDPLLLLARERLCGDGVLDDVFTLFHFEKGGTLQTLLHHLKYGGAAGIGRWLGGQVGLAMRECSFAPRLDAIVPVPLHTAKRRERGYNQSASIAGGIGTVLRLPVDAGLVGRIRHTSTQTALGIEERKSNMAGAFATFPKRQRVIEGRGFLLVDDVITTGATIRSCAQALRAAGAGSIVACAVGLAEKTMAIVAAEQ
jgi:ComF family protein